MKQRYPLARYGRVLSTLIALSVGLVTSANASTITAYITYDTGAESITLSSSFNSYTAGATMTAPTGGWTDAFSLAATATNLYIGNAGNYSIYRYSQTGGTNTGNFTMSSDGSGVSPQEIALDTAGNLYTTAYAGNITEFNASNVATVIQDIPGARGILIDGNKTYVDTSADGSGKVYEFATGTTATPTLIYTTGAYPDGQLRGMAIDSNNNLYIADSGWAANGSKSYIEKLTNFGTPGNSTASTFLVPGTFDLDDPNSIAIQSFNGTYGLFVGEYGSGDITEYNISNGNFVNDWSINGVTHIQGLVFAGSEGVGTAEDPIVFAAVVAPEPGTGTLLFLAFLFIATLGFYCRKVRTR